MHTVLTVLYVIAPEDAHITAHHHWQPVGSCNCSCIRLILSEFYFLYQWFQPCLNSVLCGLLRRILNVCLNWSGACSMQDVLLKHHSAPWNGNLIWEKLQYSCRRMCYTVRCAILLIQLWAIIQHSTVVWELTEEFWIPQPLRDHLCTPAWQIRATEYSCTIPPLITLD